MKVIKDGKVEDPGKWETSVTCKKVDMYDVTGCGSVMQVAAGDLVLMYWKGSHFRHHYAAVKCPRCGKHTKVRVPGPVYLKLDTSETRGQAIFDGHSNAI